VIPEAADTARTSGDVAMWRCGDERHRNDISANVETGVGRKPRPCGQRAVGSHAEGLPVVGGRKHLPDADHAARTWAVLHDYGLAQAFSQRLVDDPR
jgi:hypothetical protein